MSDFERDSKLTELFAELNGAVTECARPIGAEATQVMLHRRHRNRVIAAGVLTMALIATPIVAGATLRTNRDKGAVTDSVPTFRPTVSASASEVEPQTPSPEVRISLSDLKNATLSIPAWPEGLGKTCAAGTVRFVDGKNRTGTAEALIVGDLVQVDVDRDGTAEAVVVVACPTVGNDYKVLAFKQDDSGTIRTFGQVLATVGPSGKQGTDVVKVWSIAAGQGGRINIDVGEYRPCCVVPQDLPQHQWRAYAWDGQRFDQVDGPTSFDPNPKVTDLTVDASATALARQSNGTWTGTLRIIIGNRGPMAVPATVKLTSDTPLTANGSGCTISASEVGRACIVGTAKVDNRLTVTMNLVMASLPSGTLTVDVSHCPDPEAPGTYPDLDHTNNTEKITLTQAPTG